MTMEDRPATLPRRTTPRPSPSENVDPIDISTPLVSAPSTSFAPTAFQDAPADTPAPLAVESATPSPSAPVTVNLGSKKVRPPREREVVVQLNSKISLEAREALDRITQRDGGTLRSAIETGIFLLEYLTAHDDAGDPDPSMDELLAIYRANS